MFRRRSSIAFCRRPSTTYHGRANPRSSTPRGSKIMLKKKKLIRLCATFEIGANREGVADTQQKTKNANKPRASKSESKQSMKSLQVNKRLLFPSGYTGGLYILTYFYVRVYLVKTRTLYKISMLRSRQKSRHVITPQADSRSFRPSQ